MVLEGEVLLYSKLNSGMKLSSTFQCPGLACYVVQASDSVSILFDIC